MQGVEKLKHSIGESVVLTSGIVYEIQEVNKENEYYVGVLVDDIRVNYNFVDSDIDDEETLRLKEKNKALDHYQNMLKASMSPKERKVERHKELTKLMNDIYQKKNSDYGDSFSKVHKEIGWQSSLGDIAHKFYRLQNLLQNEEKQQVADETVFDTIVDMSNYLIMLYMELEEGNEKT